MPGMSTSTANRVIAISNKINRVAVIGKWVIVVIAVLVGLKLATGSTTHNLRIEYGAMPGDDQALAKWLHAQPTVTTATVAREGKTLVLSFTVPTRGGAAPDVVREAEQLGYQQRGDVSLTKGMNLW
jgi:hypothetical protein